MFWSNPHDCSSLQPNQHSPQPALWAPSAKRVLFPHLRHLQETWQRMVQKHAKTTRAVIVHHKHVMEKNGNACSNTHLDVQLHLRMCVHPCILDIFCPMNIYSMPCNYAKKKTNRTVKQKTRWFPHPWPKLRTLGPRSLRQQF